MIAEHDHDPRDDDGPAEGLDNVDPAEDAEDAGVGPVTAGELLRQALVDDEDPRFPRWLPLPGIVLALAWAAYQAVAGDAGVLPALGVSAAIAAGTTVVAWFGWQLEID